MISTHILRLHYEMERAKISRYCGLVWEILISFNNDIIIWNCIRHKGSNNYATIDSNIKKEGKQLTILQ